MDDRPVPRDVVECLLENANWAPTHGLTEPWRFHVFTGEGRGKLAAQLQTLYQEHTTTENYRPEKYEKLGKNPLLAPVVVALVMKRDPSGKIPELEEIAAVACAVQNMHLTATALGLGAFWSSPPIVYTQGMNAFLGLTKEDRCLGLFYLGWPKEGVELKSHRGPVAEKTIWVA